MPTEPKAKEPSPVELILTVAVIAILLVALAVLAPQSLTAVGVTVIACCQLRKLF
jgi:hypothetical protein